MAIWYRRDGIDAGHIRSTNTYMQYELFGFNDSALIQPRVASLAFFKPNFSILAFSKEVWLKKMKFGLYLVFCFFEEKHRKSAYAS